ncbi:MAG: hypothetical protein JW747_01230 [Candidatus Aminicenantes bacterium]|nr:hypothetical protein [Candidatus Aminicenantes bacterium]
MNKTVRRALAAALVAAVAAVAAPVKAQQSFKTTIYFDYSFFLSNDGPKTSGALDNAFRFRRAYFNYENKISGNLKFRFRYDADNTANITGVNFADSSTKKDDKFRPFIKHLFMQYDNLLPNSSIKVGMADTLTFGQAEDRWGFRSVAKTLMDGYKDVTGASIDATSADLGASLTGSLSKHFRYGFMISNGSHYSHVETDKYKKIMVQAMIMPVAGFSVVGYMDHEKQSGSADAQTYKLDAYFEKIKNLTLAFEWFTYKNDANMTAGNRYDRQGWSLFGRYVLKAKKLTVFGRLDQYEPNTEVGDDKIGLIIAGFEWQPLASSAFKLQPNVWFTTYENSAKKNDIVAVVTFFWSF